MYGTFVFVIVTLTKIALEINKNVLMMTFEAKFDFFFSLEFTILKIFFSKKSAVCDEDFLKIFFSWLNVNLVNKLLIHFKDPLYSNFLDQEK